MKRFSITLFALAAISIAALLLILNMSYGQTNHQRIDPNTDPVLLSASQHNFDKYQEVVSSSSYLLHALGSSEGHTYLNSVRVASDRYQDGARLFEADFSWTADHELVL